MNSRGTTAIEFAILAPVLLAFLLGITEFGRAFWIRQTLQFAVEEAARAALVNSALSASDISNLVTADLTGLQNVTPAITVTNSATQIGVSASAPFTFIVPNLLPFGPFTLTASCTFPR